MRIAPSLNGLPPGQHGIHVHEKNDCGPAEDKGKQTAGMAAEVTSIQNIPASISGPTALKDTRAICRS